MDSALPVLLLLDQMFKDQNALKIKITEIKQCILSQEVSFRTIDIILKGLPDSFSGSVDHCTELPSHDPVISGIHISPNIKKGVLIFYDQNILRCLLGTGIIRKRL